MNTPVYKAGESKVLPVQAMKSYGERGIATGILNYSSGLKCAVSNTLRLLNPSGTAHVPTAYDENVVLKQQNFLWKKRNSLEQGNNFIEDETHVY
jgi:hypothetical protein